MKRKLKVIQARRVCAAALALLAAMILPILPSGGDVTLSWPVSFGRFVLQQNPDVANWLEEHRHELFAGANEGDEITEAQRNELLRRRQEYFDHPELFIRLNTAEELDRFFEDIRREVQVRVSSARQS